MEYIDIHTHILPRLDDGAASAEESLALIEELRKQGVTKIIATPHFYADRSALNDVILNSEKALRGIIELLSDNSPDIKLGFEVHYFKNISKSDSIKLLTLNSTNYLLLELSYSQPCDTAADDIISLSLNHNITPVLAHVERYSGLPGFEKILETIHDGFAIGQINASSVCDSRLRKTALNLINNNYGTIIASDTHSISRRPPEIENAFKIISKKLGEKTKDRLKTINNCFCTKIISR